MWSAWAPDNLLANQGESIWYYAVAFGNAVVSVLLPVFLLGAFVFKLFKHDPLAWREAVTLEAHASGNYALTVRFYNRMTENVADLNVRAWIRWNPPDLITVARNRRVDLLVRGELDNAPFWPLATPGEPTTIRVLLCRTEDEADPLREDAIFIQGEWIPRKSAKLLIVVTGALSEVNEEFRSTKIYDLSAEKNQIQEDIFQDISIGETGPRDRQVQRRSRQEWANFHGTQAMYVFMYGSLMREEDLRRARLEPKEAILVKLDGWRRSWNVASDPASKDRTYRLKSDNSVYGGMIASLGLERHEGSAACGVMAKVDYRVLAEFDAREQEYDRTDVTHDVRFYSARPTGHFRVFAYVPKPAAVREYARQLRRNNLAIRKGYYESIKEASHLAHKDCMDDFLAASSRLEGVEIIDMDFPGGIS